MKIDARVERILDMAQEGRAPGREDCALLLELPETGLEAAVLRAMGDSATRRRFNNEGIILAQIGIEIAACPGRCKFCSFGEGHTAFQPHIMTDEDVLQRAAELTASGDLYALFLMTMHTFDFERLLRIVRIVRERIPQETGVVVNIGDFDKAQARDLKEAGVDGAYHVCRLREGIDTSLDPERRKATMRTIKDSGLDFYYCCEPIGPEHTTQELIEQMFVGIEYGCVQHAAMRRVCFPSAPLSPYGQISELRLGQITAVVALATLECPETRCVGVHEPNMLGITAGANTVFAETGANPRDTEEDTTGHRGLDITGCKIMLYEAGFESILTSPGKRVSLTEPYR